MRSTLRQLTDPHQFDLTPLAGGDVLDLGCGSAKAPGAVGIDISSETDADIVHDLDTFPYPIEDNSFDHVLMQDVIEHLEEPIRVMEEVHRVLRPRGRVDLRTPHFSSALAYGDPTHRHAFSSIAIRSLAEPGFAHYTPVRFSVIQLTLDLWLPFRLLGIGALANRAPENLREVLCVPLSSDESACGLRGAQVSAISPPPQSPFGRRRPRAGLKQLGAP